MYCGKCGEKLKNGEKVCLFCGCEQEIMPQWKGISLDFISDKEEKEEPLEKPSQSDKDLSENRTDENAETFFQSEDPGESAICFFGYNKKRKTKQKETEKSIRYIQNSESINYNRCFSIDFVRWHLYQSIAEKKR